MDRSRDIRTHLLSADKNVFNSSVGVVTGLSPEEQELRVFMDETEEVVCSCDELDESTHAYAVTAHRSQGSEYPCVILPLSTSAWHMLRHTLLYTAVTRAKRLVVLVGSKRTIARAVRNEGAGRRYAALAERLRRGQHQGSAQAGP